MPRLRPSALVRRGLGLSADTFSEIVRSRCGGAPDLERVRAHFEPIGATLVDSFYATIDDCRPDRITRRLDGLDPALRGIAYEGVGMGLTVVDTVLPTRRRFAAFVHGPGEPYRTQLYVGAGLVLPRLPRATRRHLDGVHPFDRWWVMNGYGFYDGWFAWDEAVRGWGAGPGHYSARGYDQGLGRAVWFCTGADVDRIAGALSAFPVERHCDLWRGLGLACAYAAEIKDRDGIATLAEAAGIFAADLATGAAIAAGVRARRGHSAPQTELACEVLWRRTSDAVARIVLAGESAHRATADATGHVAWQADIRATWMAQGASPGGAVPDVLPEPCASIRWDPSSGAARPQCS